MLKLCRNGWASKLSKTWIARKSYSWLVSNVQDRFCGQWLRTHCRQQLVSSPRASQSGVSRPRAMSTASTTASNGLIPMVPQMQKNQVIVMPRGATDTNSAAFLKSQTRSVSTAAQAQQQRPEMSAQDLNDFIAAHQNGNLLSPSEIFKRIPLDPTAHSRRRRNKKRRHPLLMRAEQQRRKRRWLTVLLKRPRNPGN